MKKLITLYLSIAILLSCGSHNDSSARVYSTPEYTPQTGIKQLKDEDVVLIAGNSDRIVLLNSLNGERKIISLKTHENYKVGQALITTDRNHIIYTANQDNEGEYDLYIYNSTIGSSQKLFNAIDDETITNLSTTSVNDEILISCINKDTAKDSFYLLNLGSMVIKELTKNINSYFNFLSEENQKFYTIEDNESQDLALYELDTMSLNKRIVSSLRDSYLNINSEFVTQTDGSDFIFHNNLDGDIFSLNSESGHSELFDNQSHIIVHHDNNEIMYLKTPVDASSQINSFSFVISDYRKNYYYNVLNLENSRTLFTPVKYKNLIYFVASDSDYVWKQYIHDIENSKTSEISDFLVNSRGFHTSDESGKVIFYQQESNIIHVTDIGKLKTDNINIGRHHIIYQNTFSDNGQYFISTIIDSSTPESRNLISLDLNTNTFITHEISDLGDISSICSLSGASCYGAPLPAIGLPSTH